MNATNNISKSNYDQEITPGDVTPPQSDMNKGAMANDTPDLPGTDEQTINVEEVGQSEQKASSGA
jgi:hypothetical protein